MSPRLHFVFALSLITASGAFADEISYTATAGPIAVGASGNATLPKFDPSLGVLREVRVNVLAGVSGTWGVENTAAHADGVGGYASGEYVGVLLPVSLPAGGMNPPNPAFLPDPSVPLTSFDGTVDYAGTSGTTFTFVDQYGDGSPGQHANIYMDAGLQAYVGTSPFTVVLGPVFQVGPLGPPWFQNTATITTGVSLQVRYTYEPFPTTICSALPWSGCPCNNRSSNNNGCANSAGPFGGDLQTIGVASISADTLVLGGLLMTNSSALYFQGTTFDYAQSVYGDGLRCVTGTIARLGIKTNANGSSQYPEAGDPPISVRGGVTSPGPRYYQVVYRDGGNFCTPSQFNATSGLAILWAP